jgi:hypothetical protein
VVSKPRPFYVCSFPGAAVCTGCPVFDAGARTLGVFGVHSGQSVVLPAADVLEAAKHAAAAKSPKP